MRAIGIMGIHTGIGKTITSAVLTEALQADYWKPVQAGSLDNSDSIIVKSLLTNTKSIVHPEAVVLTQPLSPHKAAKIDGVVIDYQNFVFPETNNLLLVETAGGVHSPMNDVATMADFAAYHKLPVVLVTKHYLGSINHTLLSIETLKKRNIELLGIIVNGDKGDESESFITNYTGVPIILHIPEIEVTAVAVNTVATSLRFVLKDQSIWHR